MEEIIDIVCPEKHCSLAALDVVGQLHCSINFNILRKKLVQLQDSRPCLSAKVTELIDMLSRVEETLGNRNRFKSADHFCATRDRNGPAIHCHYYAFGKVDPIDNEDDEILPDKYKFPCGHYHEGTCISQLCGSQWPPSLKKKVY